MTRRSQTLPDAAKRRDGVCLRCRDDRDLHAHHIVPLHAGGPDTLDNLATLCQPCHRSWHRSYEGLYAFAAFLDTIPESFLIDQASDPANDGVTLGELRQRWNFAVILRSRNPGELSIEALPMMDPKAIRTMLDRIEATWRAERDRQLSIYADNRKFGRPLKTDPAKVLEWRLANNARLEDVAEHFAISLSTAQRYCARAPAPANVFVSPR